MTQPANIPANITMTLDQYTSLVALAREGVRSRRPREQQEAYAGLDNAVPQQGDQVALEQFLVQIEKANGVSRFLLWVRWQELDEPVPPKVQFPTNWPLNLQRLIQQINRPVALTDVQDVLTTYAKNPVNVMVTRDPNAALGWTQLSVFFEGEVD